MNNLTKHTPGKWIVRKWDGEQWPERRWSVSVDESGISKAICISPKYFTHEPESLANAQLIASAPELLEENESLKRDFEEAVTIAESHRKQIESLKAINKQLLGACIGITDILENHLGDDDDETEAIENVFDAITTAKSFIEPNSTTK